MNNIFSSAVVLSVYLLTVFYLAILKRDNSIMDMFYGPAFIVISGWLYVNQDIVSSIRSTFIMCAVALWGVRLAYRICKKNHGKPEDFRYAAWRKDWMKKGEAYFLIRSFLQVFVLQGVVVLVVALPIMLGHSIQTDSLRWYHIFGMILWLIGFLYEAIADAQLDRFLRSKNKVGTIMKTGLWRYSRHPNYFGESLQWWGLALVVFLAVDNSLYAFLSPLLITYLLLNVSGVPMLEKHFDGNPEWEEYKKKTPVFVPKFF